MKMKKKQKNPISDEYYTSIPCLAEYNAGQAALLASLFFTFHACMVRERREREKEREKEEERETKREKRKGKREGKKDREREGEGRMREK